MFNIFSKNQQQQRRFKNSSVKLIETTLQDFRTNYPEMFWIILCFKGHILYLKHSFKGCKTSNIKKTSRTTFNKVQRKIYFTEKICSEIWICPPYLKVTKIISCSKPTQNTIKYDTKTVYLAFLHLTVVCVHNIFLT